MKKRPTEEQKSKRKDAVKKNKTPKKQENSKKELLAWWPEDAGMKATACASLCGEKKKEIKRGEKTR